LRIGVHQEIVNGNINSELSRSSHWLFPFLGVYLAVIRRTFLGIYTRLAKMSMRFVMREPPANDVFAPPARLASVRVDGRTPDIGYTGPQLGVHR